MANKVESLLQSAKQSKQEARPMDAPQAVPGMEPAESIEQLIARCLITHETKVEPTRFLVDCWGVPFLAMGNITIVRGKKKSGKSSVLRDLIRNIFTAGDMARPRNSKPIKVGYFDLEMSAFDTQRVYEGIPADKQKNLFGFNLTEEENQLDKVMAISDHLKLDVVIVDTLTEAVQDINDQQEARNMVLALRRWNANRGNCLLATIHTNKSDNNSQGAWGGKLEQKCFDSLLVEMMGDYDYQQITHTDARDRAPGQLSHIKRFYCVVDEGYRQYTQEKPQ